MPKIIFVNSDGNQTEVDSADGATVMETAIKNMVNGIEAECGGACACATCHVYVDDEWADKVDPADPMEEDMLDFAYDIKPTSRLACQVKVSGDMDGLTIHIPERQA